MVLKLYKMVKIKLRTTKEEFNATNRTLSNILNEIVQNVTDGTTIRYDDNGVAQAFKCGATWY